MNFLWENKEWIFSGIGLVLIGGIIAIIKAIRNRNKMQRISTTENINNEPNGTVGNNAVIDSETKTLLENVMPDQIIEAINGLPLLQRKDAAQHYIGMFVSWRLPLLDISDDWTDPNAVSIHLYDSAKRVLGASVVFEVKRKEYPGLVLLKENHIMQVEGLIEKVRARSIYLSQAKISY